MASTENSEHANKLYMRGRKLKMDIIQQFNALLGYQNDLDNAAKAIIQTIAVIAMIPALLQCFFGLKMRKFWISFTGLCIGALIGALMGGTSGEFSNEVIMAIFFALVFGIFGVLFAFKIYEVGICIYCFVKGSIFGATLGIILGLSTNSSSAIIPLGVICGLVAAIAGVVLIEPVVIISTALSGGLAAGLSLFLLLDSKTIAVSILLGLILAGFGIYVQFKMNQKMQPVIATPPYTVQNQQQFVIPHQEDQFVYSQQPQNQNEAATNREENDVQTPCAETVKLKMKVLSFDEVCENFERIFYENKVLKYIMPLAEYLLYLLAIIDIFAFVFGCYIFFSVPLVCCIFVLAKRKYGALSISLTTLTIIVFLKTFKYFAYVNLAFQLILLSELVLYISLTVLAYKKFFTSEKGISLRQKFAATTSEPPYATPVIKVRCPSCGALCDENMTVCPTCGKVLQVQNVQVSTSEALTCPQCGNACKPDANFCPKCGYNFAGKTAEASVVAEIQEPEVALKELLCPQCGHECKLNARFCPECGQDLVKQDEKTNEYE